MLKKFASFVFASKPSSTQPRGYASDAFIGCGLADGLLEHILRERYPTTLMQ